MLHCNTNEETFSTARTGHTMRMSMMNTFQQAGEAMLLAQEGNRQIASALWRGLKTGAVRLLDFAVTAMIRAPGSHFLP